VHPFTNSIETEEGKGAPKWCKKSFRVEGAQTPFFLIRFSGDKIEKSLNNERGRGVSYANRVNAKTDD